jgi:Na+/H+ antiporter NhaD/arsenite permease-like protein
LLVGMLKEVGVLDFLAAAYEQMSPVAASYGAGLLSALIDNVPLTAALLKASPNLNTSEWLGLTYAVGVGGSLLAIGSAAGIIAMGKVKGLTFGSHLHYFPRLFVAYSLGYWATISLGKVLF